VDKIKPIKNKKSAAEERMKLLTQRQDLKQQFIDKKQTARTNINLLKVKSDSLGAYKEQQLKELQDEFRDIDFEFKELGVLAEREELFDGAKARAANDPAKMNNTEMLGKATDVENNTLSRLQVRDSPRERMDVPMALLFRRRSFKPALPACCCLQDGLAEAERAKEHGVAITETLQADREKIYVSTSHRRSLSTRGVPHPPLNTRS